MGGVAADDSLPEANHRAARAMICDRLETVSTTVDEQNRETPLLAVSTLLIAVPSGLLLGELATGENGRTEQAMQRFVNLIDYLQGWAKTGTDWANYRRSFEDQ